MLSGREKTFAAVVLLFAASAVSASPTIIPDSPARIVSPSADSATVIVTYDLGSSAACDQMSELAKAFLQPPSSDGRSTEERCLPPVPSAIAMVLTGFFCVSLIRDRRAWLTVLAGLLWVSQTGIGALPELTSRISRKIHTSQLIDTTLALPCLVEGDYFPDGYSEEIRYTGLLRHLAGIPRGTKPFTIKRISLTQLCRITKNTIFFTAENAEHAEVTLCFSPRSLRTPRWNGNVGKDTRVLHHAILKAQFVLSELSSCLVSGTRQFVCFTPAFTFCQLPRGPPISARRLFGKPVGV